MPTLLISADDYGYSAPYNEGILAAAHAGAVDVVGAMVLRADCDPVPLVRSGVAIGLHLELPPVPAGEPEEAVEAQLRRFAEAFARSPSRLDGHHHAHAADPWRDAVARAAKRIGVPVRAAGREHRDWLRGQGAVTEDVLVGRLDPADPALPSLIAELRAGGARAPGAVEWMTHPGLADAASGSGYDEAREEDLNLLLGLAEDPVLRALRGL